ncbi:PREDICTED: uncharacterized protein LOC109582564 isoform X3 [Amphimedon queenslandica]|uniref:Death domain-containing protein n=1 Tax=Amphimedon queenslandica TaxID=400682 RepID=A0AAN0J809_AMPQE|nr:PREDICTED: uncharacterized protein LOC109582564 isoform X3 [Amphimedon queenslandica]|eukprot:XP_019852866.1 PREDICTED: uncharacterized protein LOC109582564 isoform X3 [Amphimedon queenslandica]
MATAHEGKPPADIFQEVFDEISPLIGKRKNFTNVTNNFFAKKLITKIEINQIESEKNLNDDERGQRIADLLVEKLDDENEDSAQCLLKICDVFESKKVNNEPLRRLGANMREQLSSPSKEQKPAKSMWQKLDSTKESDAGYNATQNSKQKDKESGDEETDGPAEGGYHLLKYCKAKHLKECGALIILAIIIVLAGVAINHLNMGKENATTDAIPASTEQPHYSSTPDGAEQLDAKDVDKILKVLDKVLFGATKWNDLGLRLGLYQPRLNVFADSGGNAYRHLRKTIEAWLDGEDNARSRTWQTLIDAVEGTGNRAAAEKIPQKLKELYNITV